MATNNGGPHLQIRHNLSGLYLADWKWLHPIVIAFNTLCPYFCEHISQSIIYIKKKGTPNLVAKILATKLGFVPDW